MLHPLRKKIGDGLWNFIVSVMIAFSLSMLWSRAFLSEGHAVYILLRCAVIVFVLAVMDQLPGRVWKPIFYTGIVCVGVGFAFFGIGPVFEMVQGCKAMFLQWALRPESSAGDPFFYAAYYAEDLRNLFCLIICILVYAQIAEDALGTCIFMFVVFTALPYMLIQFPNFPVLPFSAAEGLRMAAPGAAGLVMMMGSRGGRRAGLLPVAALLTASALFMAPAEGTVDPEISRMAEQVSWIGRDLFYTGENRSAFSFASTDYMPLKDRLGGSVKKTSDPVMQVTTDAKDHVYMKGSYCDTYTGFGWQDTLSDRGYLFKGPLSGANRDKVFGENQIMEADRVTIRVMMLRNASTTVFSPQRIVSFNGESERMVLYFNGTGELYITRELEKGDRYSIDCLLPGEDDARTYISNGAEANDSRWDEVCSQYLGVPECVSPVVKDMTMDIIFGINDPLERASAIRDYLIRKYPYSLETGVPDPDEDFVSWFLLKEKRGYCTYFASAMTIMCRIAGIPARYAVGYAFIPSDDGTVTLTTGDGHAWTEIYLKGFGWLTMDATGSQGSGNRRSDRSGDNKNNGQMDAHRNTPVPSTGPDDIEDENGSGTEDPSTISGQTTPSPSPTATPSQAPRPEMTPDNTDPRPTLVPGGNGPDQKDKEGNIFILIIIIMLILAALISIILILYRMTSPDHKALRHPEEAAKIYYEEAFRICREKYGDIHSYETWPEYAERIQTEEEKGQMLSASKEYQDMFYKKDYQPHEDLARQFCMDMWSKCGLKIRIKLFLQRLKRR